MNYRDDDRPRERKSWKEIDRARESGQRRQAPEDRDRERGLQQNSSAYEKYKKNLERLWNSGGKLMEDLEKQAPAAQPTPEEPLRPVVKRSQEDRQKERDAREALRKAVGPVEVKQSVEAYLSVVPKLPDDMELLSKVLASPSERHQLAALRVLDERTDLATSQSARLLKSRLQTVLLTASEADTKTLAQSVRAKVG